MLIPGDDVVCVDLNGCRDPVTGEAEAWAAELLALLDSYTELSMTGTGFHIFCRAEGHFADVRMEEPRVRIYGQEHFVRVTGVRVDAFGPSVAERSVEVHRLVDGLGARDGLDSGQYSGLSFPSTADDRGLDDLLKAVQANGLVERWVMVGLVLHNEFTGESEGLDVWRNWSADQADPVLDEQNASQAWESFEPPPWMNLGVLDYLYGGTPPETTRIGEDFE